MERRGRRFHKDVYGGLMVAVFGVIFAWKGASYSIGTLSRMGPGYFPVALGVILALSGIAIALKGYLTALPIEEKKPLPPEWRAWFLIGAAIIAFVLLAERAGLMVATFAIVFISALGDRDNNWKQAAVLSLAMVVVAVVVFWWALQIQLPLWPGRS